MITYWLETRNVCQYCLGSAVCYDCGGEGCEECHGFGCPYCEGGKETWLFFTRGDGKRGSCLERAEIAQWRADGTLPAWWATYHRLTEQPA